MTIRSKLFRWCWFPALVLLCVASPQTRAASVITGTITFTNAANLTNAVGISNALVIANSDTRTFTNSIYSPSTQIRIASTIGTNTVQQMQQLLIHVSTHPFAGLTPIAGVGFTNLHLRGTNDQALTITLHPDNWGSVTYATQSVGSAVVHRTPFSSEPLTTRTNIATDIVDLINKYTPIANRFWTNFGFENVSFTSLSLLGSFTAGYTNPPLVWAGTTNIYTNSASDFVVAFTNAANTALINLTNVLPSAVSGRMITIKDAAGTASGTNIWIMTPWNYQKIDGVSTNYTITNDFGSVTLMAIGTNWNVVSDGRFSTAGAAASFPTAIKIDNLLATNAIGRLRSLVPSPNTTNQIDIANGPMAYYWTNMATNIVLQCTNVWTAGVTNRTIDFFFTGHASLPFNVTFTCPNPAGVAFRWGFNSATNGLTSFTVTNGMAVGASLTFWETNLAEVYFSPVR